VPEWRIVPAIVKCPHVIARCPARRPTADPSGTALAPQAKQFPIGAMWLALVVAGGRDGVRATPLDRTPSPRRAGAGRVADRPRSRRITRHPARPWRSIPPAITRVAPRRSPRKARAHSSSTRTCGRRSKVVGNHGTTFARAACYRPRDKPASISPAPRSKQAA